MPYTYLTCTCIMYMWTVMWRLTPVLLRLFTICKLSSQHKEKAQILCNQPPVWFCPQLNAGLELFGHGHLATLYRGGG